MALYMDKTIGGRPSTWEDNWISCLSASPEEPHLKSVTILVKALHSCQDIAPGLLRQQRGKHHCIKSTVMGKKYGFETEEFNNIIAVMASLSPDLF